MGEIKNHPTTDADGDSFGSTKRIAALEAELAEQRNVAEAALSLKIELQRDVDSLMGKNMRLEQELTEERSRKEAAYESIGTLLQGIKQYRQVLAECREELDWRNANVEALKAELAKCKAKLKETEALKTK